MSNNLNHRNKLAKLHGSAKLERSEKRWTYNKKRARSASKAYNRAARKASKNQLRGYKGVSS